MPALIKFIEEIVRERGRDTYWLRFAHSLFANRDVLRRIKEDHLAWIDEQGVKYETAAPKGWMEGDPGCFAVYFDGPEDPRLHAYCSKFEQPDGGSLQPNMYQMYLYHFGQAEAEQDADGSIHGEDRG